MDRPRIPSNCKAIEFDDASQEFYLVFDQRCDDGLTRTRMYSEQSPDVARIIAAVAMAACGNSQADQRCDASWRRWRETKKAAAKRKRKNG